MGDLKYKIGDKVRIKSLDWYNENKDEYGYVYCGERLFYPVRSKLCGKIFTISKVFPNYYLMSENDYEWTDEMIEGLMKDGTIVDYVKESNDRYRIVIDPRFDIEVDEGEYYAVRRKKEYPKTYEECYKIMDIDTGFLLTSYDLDFWKGHLLTSLQKLYICRDAYWKIAGEEMGLGKPWEPDYDSGVNKFGIICLNGVAQESNPTTNWERHLNKILDFPTEEMRDAFFNAFRDDIEKCKELI